MTEQGGSFAVPLRSRRRRRALFVKQISDNIQHAVPAMGLLAAGFQSLNAGAQGFERFLAVAGIATSGLLFVSIIRGLRAVRELKRTVPSVHPVHETHAIDWTDVFVAGVLFTEAAEKWRVRRHLSGPVILTGFVSLWLGLFHGRLAARMERRQSLRLTDEHIFVGGKPWNRMSAKWADVKEIQIADHEAVIHTHRGRRRRLNFKDLENAEDVRAALEHARQRLIETPAAGDVRPGEHT